MIAAWSIITVQRGVLALVRFESEEAIPGAKESYCGDLDLKVCKQTIL